jgi:hypothetical protein
MHSEATTAAVAHKGAATAQARNHRIGAVARITMA